MRLRLGRAVFSRSDSPDLVAVTFHLFRRTRNEKTLVQLSLNQRRGAGGRAEVGDPPGVGRAVMAIRAVVTRSFPAWA